MAGTPVAKIEGQESATSAASIVGENKVIATAHHIVNSLASDKSSADDMLRILSFDHRFDTLIGEEPPIPHPRLEEATRVVSLWDSDSLLFEASDEARSDYLSAVDDVISLSSNLSVSSAVRSKAEILLQIAISRLEDEFRHLMIRNTYNADDVAIDPQSEIHMINPDAVPDLRAIADRMIAASYHNELREVYTSVRRDALDECLLALGVERVSIEEVQRVEWNALDEKMRKWVNAARVVIKALLASERRFCKSIFGVSEKLTYECFLESSKGCVLQLLNFGDAVAIGRRSSEKLFRILDMYDALSEVMPELKNLFGGDFVVVEAEDVLVRLGDAARETINEFANAVQTETSKKVVLNGDIHPLTRYVMNYVKLLVEYSSLLDSLLDEKNDEADDSETGTPLGCWLRLLISYLDTKLEEKTVLYEEAALQYIFLMNNRHYIIQKVKGTDLGKLLGEDWVRKRRGQIRQYHNSYLRASWTRALSFLKDDGMSGSGSVSLGGVSRDAIKDRFRSFNIAFEEIYKTQTTWKVSDPQLREELCLSTAEKIVPAYRSFLGRIGAHVVTARHTAKYIKYTPEDLETHLSKLLQGTTQLLNHSRRKHSS